MQKRRLLKLAKILREDAARKKGIQFDMTKWGVVKDVEKPVSCGTQACAMGLAAISGAFKRQGLGFRTNGFGDLQFLWKGAYSSAIEVIENLFEIDNRDQIHLLFSPGYDNNEGAVAERAKAKQIEKFVKVNGDLDQFPEYKDRRISY